MTSYPPGNWPSPPSPQSQLSSEQVDPPLDHDEPLSEPESDSVIVSSVEELTTPPISPFKGKGRAFAKNGHRTLPAEILERYCSTQHLYQVSFN